MYARVRLYSNKRKEIYNFLTKIYNINSGTSDIFNTMYVNSYEWENIYENPIDIANILGIFIDNIDSFKITMWVSLDKDVFVRITSLNGNSIIKYLYERYPYN